MLLPEDMDLQLWWDMPAYADNPSGRRVYPEWYFSFVILNRRGVPGIFLRGRHCDKCSSSPSGTCGTLPIPWQISPPQDQVPICHPSSLGGTYVLPPSTLIWWHVGTSHAIPPTSEGFQAPTGGIHPGIVLH